MASIGTLQSTSIADTTTGQPAINAPKSIGYDPATNTFYGYKIRDDDAFGKPGLKFIEDRSLKPGSKSIHAVRGGSVYLFRCASPDELEAGNGDVQVRAVQFMKVLDEPGLRGTKGGRLPDAPHAHGRSQMLRHADDTGCSERKQGGRLLQAEAGDVRRNCRADQECLDWYYHISRENVSIYSEGSTYKVQFTHAEGAIPMSMLRSMHKSAGYEAWRKGQDQKTAEMYREIYTALMPKEKPEKIAAKVSQAMAPLLSSRIETTPILHK
ncbi:hypothetical protein SYNPS1DRAFT_29825 [Syncephalis pseudoplumigaleata]|uniref:Uncharacterized protein n=1 Tax=Syncephalis pseudoplumigaleata TaxID=1712513 RepID=A0A4V1J1A8_9FUNG|nr:hypothetical protein SYNPS1DRAFT_29825 [Syncephalis pseudoplumigaleata]|eukprot:RKP24409.1 hypothetical protein SYNPS1DRAFT_29825 [Syncephalis pseudoplumigaleata]